MSRTLRIGSGRRRFFRSLAAAFEHAARIRNPALLQIAILQPLVVVSAHGRRSSCFLASLVHHRHRRLVGLDFIFPHAKGQENVRGHVLRMTGIGRNLRIDARGAQSERRMDRVIVAMNQVVDHAGMVRMLSENLFEHRSRAHIGGKIASVLGGPQRRKRVEGSPIHIFRKFAVDFGEQGLVLPGAFFLCSVAEEDFCAAQIEFFPLRGGFGKPSFRRGCQALEDLAGVGDIFLVPYRMILRHGFTPKGHDEVRCGLLSLAEVFGGILVFEVVELSQAEKEVCLRGRRTRIRKCHFAEVLLSQSRRRT